MYNLFQLVTHRKTVRRPRTIAKNIGNAKKNHWLWVLGGVLAGVLMSTAVFMKFQAPKKNVADSKNNSNNTVQKAPLTIATEKEPVFDFYTVLPNMDTVAITNNTEPNKTTQIINNEATLTASSTAKVEAANPNKNTKYFVQIATVTKINAADELKAKLTLDGFDTKIEPIKKNDAIWYRVIMGPFSSEQQALKQQKLLAQQKINGNLLRIKQEE
jgi:cell division protein FtsN